MKSSKMVVTGAPCSSTPNSASDHNQPIDLAQKSHSARSSEVLNNVKSGTATLVHFETQLIAANNSGMHAVDCKQGVRKEGQMSGTTVALVSRQPSFQVAGSTGTALNLVSPNSGAGTTLRSVQHPSSVSFSMASSCPAGSPPPSAHSGYHIPKGAAAVANMAASRSQGLASIVRTSSQQAITTITAPAINASRSGLVGPRVVPISSGPTWANRSSPVTGVITSKLSTPAPVSARASVAAARPQNNAPTPYGSTVQKASNVSANIRPQASGVRTVVSEVLRVQTPKGVQIAHPIPHTQKYITAGSNISARGLPPGGMLSPGAINASSCQNMYTPSSTLVTSLASSGTTITPHPPVRPPSAAIPVRLTSASAPSSQGMTHSSTITAITMAPTSSTPTCSALLTHHPSSMQQVQHMEPHHVPIKTPIVRNTLASNHTKLAFGNVSGGTQIALSGSKIITQGQHGGNSTLTVAQIPNVSTVNTKVNTHSQAAQSSAFIRGGINLPGVSISQGDRIATTVPQYSITTAPYYIDSNQSSISASIIPPTLGSSHYVPTSVSSSTVARTTGNGILNTSATSEAGNHSTNSISTVKPNSSPRPSILRKRPDFEGVPLKAAKNLSHALSIPISSPSSPKRPDSRGNGPPSSSSANSSPNVQIEADLHTSVKNSPLMIKREAVEESGAAFTSVPNRTTTHINKACATSGHSSGSGAPFSYCPVPLNIPMPKEGMSPRKKPRKQKLMGNELQEAPNSEDDTEQHYSLKKLKKEINFTQTPPTHVKAEPIEMDEEKPSWSELAFNLKSEPKSESPSNSNVVKLGSSSPEPVVVNSRPHMCLLSSYRQTWKPRHNHFVRHTEIRPKEEKKKTVNEIANQKMAFQKANGWKVMHLSGQVEGLVELEDDVVERLRLLLCVIEKRNHDYEKDVNRLSELVKANLQRSKIIRDQMSDAKVQMSKIFDHKNNIVEIMSKYSNKRTLKKKEKF